jgi:hypothetical protein
MNRRIVGTAPFSLGGYIYVYQTNIVPKLCQVGTTHHTGTGFLGSLWRKNLFNKTSKSEVADNKFSSTPFNLELNTFFMESSWNRVPNEGRAVSERIRNQRQARKRSTNL